MSKRILSLVLCAVLLVGLCGCGGMEDRPALEPDVSDIELSAADFVEGSHKRSEEYMAAFKTKGVAQDGICINFAVDVFDEEFSPKVAEEIAESYYAMRALGMECAAPVELYIVGLTTTGGPVRLGQKLYISSEYLERGEYKPYLASVMYDLEEWWKCAGLSSTPRLTDEDDTVLATELEAYLSMNGGSHLLSLHPCYFLEELADETTRDLAKDCARSLSEFIIREDGFEAFVSDSGSGSRDRWLESMGLGYDVSFLDSEASMLLDSMEYSEFGDVDMLLTAEDFRLEVNCVDWLADAEDTYAYLLGFSKQLIGFYSHLEAEAPEYFAWLGNDNSKAVVKFRDSDYPMMSHASFLKAEAIITRGEDILHEFCHALKRRSMNDENRWLCEGLTTYLTAPYIPYSAAPYWVDNIALAADIEGATEMDYYFFDLTERWFEKVNGCDISEIYNMEQPIYLIQQAMGYAALFNPEIESLRGATRSMNDQFVIQRYYPANELSYFESMLFVDWLVEKYGLDTVISAEMYSDCYFDLFPNADAFEAEFAEFWKECIEPLAADK